MPRKDGLDFNLTKLRKDNVTDLPERPAVSIANDRHIAMKDAIAPYAKKTGQKNLTSVYIDYKTRNTKICWVLCPEWAPEFPPFNLARLSGVCKSAGYESWIVDLNAKIHKIYMDDWQPNKRLPFRLWNPANTWRWRESAYLEYIHPLIEPILTEAIDDIIERAPDIVGFTMYYIGESATNWMAEELKRRAPHIKLAVGGSNTHQDWFKAIPEFDYAVKGEGEAAILKILDELENGINNNEQLYLSQPEKERINISEMPMPDYEGIDFNDYTVPNGVTSEFSRGCTAKCTFCDETHFWRYRQRRAEAVLEEAEWLWYNRGVDIMWFIDSLVNGDPDELRAFSLGIKAKNLPTKWTGYARCDGRMDDAFFKDLAEGGCIMFNYGCESGSQKVLDAMHKGVTIKEMEENFRLGKKYGIWAATNWIVGFPNEELNDYAQTMTCMWRNRNNNLNNISSGVGMAVGPESIVGQNPARWGISSHKYMGHWMRQDLSFGGTHLMHRVKFMSIFLELANRESEFQWGYPVRESLRIEHYKIKFQDRLPTVHDIEYEEFDYNIIKPNISPFADNLVNEIWPLVRMLYLTMGGFSIEVYFNPEIDQREFGLQYGPGMFTAKYIFNITHSGEWTADFTYKFDQNVDNPTDTRPKDDPYYGPFFPQDYSYMTSNPALRARRLAKPEWGMGSRRPEDWDGLFAECLELNKMDLSFTYDYKGSGKWSRTSHTIAVPDKVSSGEHLAASKNIIKAIQVDD